MTQKHSLKRTSAPIHADGLFARADQCMARWWNGHQIRVCDGKRTGLDNRCEAHQPDGSKLNAHGVPVRRLNS